MNKKGKYSPEFKEQAVKRTLSGSFTIKEVAGSLGISYFVLRQWRGEYLKKSEDQLPLTDKQLKEVYDKRSSRVTWNQLFCVTTMEGRILEKIRRSAPTYG
ncbi:transposase [Leptospira interrogans]|uniref:transposase n=1 Tax=Leptospira interrogans TaxID=173 RepID=UPI00358F3BDD